MDVSETCRVPEGVFIKGPGRFGGQNSLSLRLEDRNSRAGEDSFKQTLIFCVGDKKENL